MCDHRTPVYWNNNLFKYLHDDNFRCMEFGNSEKTAFEFVHNNVASKCYIGDMDTDKTLKK